MRPTEARPPRDRDGGEPARPPDDGTDPSGFYNIEIFAPLAPQKSWRPGMTKALLEADISRQLNDSFPGVVFNFSQVIADNVEEAMSGVKGENTVKVFGPHLEVNEAKAMQIQAVLEKVKGVEDLGIFKSLGQPNVRVTPDRVACGRYGLNVGDVEQVVQAALGGQVVTQVYEGEKHFDLVVRWLRRTGRTSTPSVTCSSPRRTARRFRSRRSPRSPRRTGRRWSTARTTSAMRP